MLSDCTSHLFNLIKYKIKRNIFTAKICQRNKKNGLFSTTEKTENLIVSKIFCMITKKTLTFTNYD